MTKIKICGLKKPELAYQTAKMGADYIGLMCYKKSKRYIDLPATIEIAAAVRRGGAEPVAVFVDHDLETIQTLCAKADINIAQLHGDISRQQQQHLPVKMQRIYVLHVDINGNIVNADEPAFASLDPQRDYILFDGLGGGTGKQINTDEIKQSINNFNFFIAGGLNSNNVGSVIEKLSPYAVDTSSGVEDETGEKSISLINEFISTVHQGDNY